MNYIIENTNLPEVKIVTSKKWEDDRGFFTEVFNVDVFNFLGIPTNFVQMNHSSSDMGVVRGLHFQWNPPMGKLMRVTRGEAFLVAVDIRRGSPTLGQWYGGIFNEDDTKQLWAPACFARGFCSFMNKTEVQYLITGTYNPKNESEIIWNDPDIGIEWGIKKPTLSKKDANAQSFKEWLKSDNSKYFEYGKK